MPITREQVIDALIGTLKPLPYVHALWEGGAAAWNRLDQWSDIDVQADADLDRISDVFDETEKALTQLSPIELLYALPEPTWHGHSQRFYKLRDASEFLLIDYVVMRHGQGERFNEVERHGNPLVHFDKSGVVTQSRVERGPWLERLQSRLDSLKTLFPMFQSLTKKELARGNDIEAVAFYYAYTLRPLVEMLRIRHVPFMHDYSTRYVHYDLPEELVRQLNQLYYVGNAQELEAKREQAERLFYSTLSDVERTGLSGILNDHPE
jgi:hypothetical protein